MWRQEFNLNAFTLHHDHPEQFTRCHWQKADRVLPLWIVYRVMMASYFLATFLYTVLPIRPDSTDESLKKYPIFLTNWTYILETVYFQLGLIVVSRKAYKENGKISEPMTSMPWYYRLYWVVYTIVLPGAFVVTTIFWTAVYDPVKFPMNSGNFIVHGLNSIMLLIELLLVAHPTKILHFYWPLSYAFTYVIFSLIYQLSGGTGVKGIIPIYKILDWRTPLAALGTCAFSTIFLMLLHIIFAMAHMLKVWIKKKRHSNTSN
ncbi:hypothetical protein RUM43_003968 [Polyplax serrata]|uniref:Protein rolling stone-like n=1 Tax=Polyplax serrata TaxID=468196 RepID=A0AAN8S2K6_POLSC